jgi:hypothetical protein
MGGSAVITITAFTTPTRFDTGTASGRRTQAAVATRSLTGDGTVSATAAIDPASDWIVHLLLVRA